MKDTGCAYCMQGETIAKFAYSVCAPGACFAYLLKERSEPGRWVCAYQDPVSEPVNLSPAGRRLYRGLHQSGPYHTLGVPSLQDPLWRLR